MFNLSHKVVDTYVEKRNNERKKIVENLYDDASNITADVQIFLQSLFIKYEADINKINLNEVKRKRELLATFALQRFNTMTKEMLRLKEEVEKMQVGIDEVLAQVKKEKEAAEFLSGVNFTGNISKKDNDSGEIDTVKLKQINILSKAVSTAKEFRQNGMTKSEILKIRELRRYLEDRKLITSVDPIKLLQESSPDIVKILPENSLLTITEVGGKVLLTLGADLVAADALTSETSRPVLFQLLDNNYQWIINLVLIDNDVPLSPDINEVATIIERNIEGFVDSMNMSGYFFSTDGLFKIFPDNEGMKSNVPQKGWKDIVAAGIATYYQEEVFVLNDKQEFTLGLCFEMPQLTLKQRIDKLVEDSPYSVILLSGALFVILISFFIIGFLGWRGSNKEKIITTAAYAGVDIRNIKPELGSLKRLQAMNRGHSVGGSRILDYTRNDALKELVRRVRKPSEVSEVINGINFEGSNLNQAAQETTVRKSVRAHKAGLRQYLK